MNDNIKRIKVLIVDDDEDYIEQQKIALEANDYEVVSARTRKDAEDIISTTKPDLAILDLMMQESDDGFVLGYHIKKKYPDVPVIIVSQVTSETGIDFDDTAGNGKWIKADAFLQKPIRFEQLKREIDRLLRA